jgi:iron(III) transport system permease protein
LGVPRSRLTLFLISVITFGVLTFLWLPVARLYATSEALNPQKIGFAFFSPLSRALLFNTLTLCFGTAALSVLFGVPVAVAAARGPRLLRAPILLLCALPIALPPTLMASAYLEYSHLPPAKSVATLAADHAFSINANFIAAPVLALCFFPLAAFATWAALQNFPRDWEDAARLFGSPAFCWTRVLLPLLSPAVLGAAGLTAALAMWEMGAPDLLDAKTYSVQIYRAFSAGESSSVAALSALPMFLLGALFFTPAWRALRFYDRWKIEHGGAASTRPTAARFATLVAIPVLCFSPLAPLLVFVDQAQPRHVFLDVWSANRNEVWNTLAAPLIASLLITIIALLLVLLWREYSSRMQHLVLSLTLAPLLFAPILLAVALLEFYDRPAFDAVYDARYGLLLVGFGARFLPLGVLWLYEAARRVPGVFEEAAQNLGAAKFHIARDIFLPLLAPAALALAALLFALCAGELSISVLLNAPGGQTLPVPIFNQMHIGATDSVAALSLTLVAISGGVLLSLLALWAKLQRR